VSPSIGKKNTNMNNYTITWQFFVIFWGWLSEPLKWLSDLQLGDKKGHFESPGNDFLNSFWLVDHFFKNQALGSYDVGRYSSRNPCDL